MTPGQTLQDILTEVAPAAAEARLAELRGAAEPIARQVAIAKFAGGLRDEIIKPKL